MFITVRVWLLQSPSQMRNPKCVYALLIYLSKLSFSSSFESRTSGILMPSTVSCINWHVWSGSSRLRSLDTILFIVENDLSTDAVPTGSRSSFLTADEKAGNMAALSWDVAKRIRLSWLCRSSGRRLRIRHSLSSSASDTPRMAAIFLKSAVSGFVMSSVCICHIDTGTGYS